jgi:ectoine hydroxylase-related dioxygenase (phytanoyl-CoA dioxygenase family)
MMERAMVSTGAQGVTVGAVDLAAVRRHLDDEGYCIIPDVLGEEELEAVRRVVDRLCAEDDAGGEPLRYGPNMANQRLHDLLNRADEFVHLVMNPVLLAAVREVLGYEEVQLSITSLNITRPGGDEGVGVLHADQSMLPGTWPQRLLVNTAIFLDDYTVENGATVFVPGSHKSPAEPPAGMPPASQLGYMTGRAGSIALWDGHIHHATGRNRTDDRQRRGMIATFFPPFLRHQENWALTLDRDVLRRHPGLDALTGFREWRSFGGVGIEGKRGGLHY